VEFGGTLDLAKAKGAADWQVDVIRGRPLTFLALTDIGPSSVGSQFVLHVSPPLQPSEQYKLDGHCSHLQAALAFFQSWHDLAGVV
jgi:hypothetical protein